MKILHIDSSITGDGSASRQISKMAVAHILREGDEVSYRDLAAEPLDHLTLAALPTDDAASGTASAVSAALLNEFLAADVVVLGVPMYNFSVSSQLKAWIDRIVIAGKTFGYTAEGPQGLTNDKRVILAIARGGYYGPDMPTAAFEHAETYLRTVFGFIGAVCEVVTADGTAVGPEQRAAGLQHAEAGIATLAA